MPKCLISTFQSISLFTSLPQTNIIYSAARPLPSCLPFTQAFFESVWSWWNTQIKELEDLALGFTRCLALNFLVCKIRVRQRCQQIWKTQQWPQDWKGKFSLQFQRRAIPKNAQITAQLHSFHMPARSCSKSSKRGFNNTWTENLQMYKLDLEKAKEPEVKLQTFVGS